MSWPIASEELWNTEHLPYDSAIWQSVKAPWELLKQPLLGELVQQGHQRFGAQRLPKEISGLVQKDCLLHLGKVYSDNIRVEEAATCHKGGMRCYSDGKMLEGACWIQAGAYFINDSNSISFGKGCLIQSGSYIEGPTAIGDWCEVRQGAFIRGNVLSGLSCIFGHTSELKGVILHDHAKAPHFAYVGDSILGAHVNLGAGTKVSNLKITGTEIVIDHQGTRHATGMRKLGGILGDKVEVGCNTVINPGVIIGRESGVYPAISVRAGTYAAKSIIRAKK